MKHSRAFQRDQSTDPGQRMETERQFTLPGRLIVILVLALLTRMNFGISLMSQVALDETVPGFAYEVVDGLVVFDGDIVVGTVEELKSSLRRKPKTPFAFRSLSRVSEPDRLWQDGIVPYVVDANIPGEHAENIEWAVKEWNSKTVITLRKRTTERDYVRFEHAEFGLCRSFVGRQGGPQTVQLPSHACNADGVAHEIGHVVGLWHEHQRVDRDKYLMYHSEDPNWGATAKVDPADGPYDYASVMHYGPAVDPHTGRMMQVSIPPGILLGSWGRGLSAGDIDGVARMYGRPPEAATIATNPPGLEVVVDGERFVSPVSFDWKPGSQHSIEVPSPQTTDDIRWLFARWNDDGGRRRTVTHDPDHTWYEANFIKQARLWVQVEPEGAGTVRVTPASVDGFHTMNSVLAVQAEPKPGSTFRFRAWGGGSGYRAIRPASNPNSVLLDPHVASVRVIAHFDTGPLFRIDSNVDSDVDPSGLDTIHIRLNDRTVWLPNALPVSEIPTGSVAVGADETQSTYRYWRRYYFDNWSDGGSISHNVEVPNTGGRSN